MSEERINWKEHEEVSDKMMKDLANMFKKFIKDIRQYLIKIFLKKTFTAIFIFMEDLMDDWLRERIRRAARALPAWSSGINEVYPEWQELELWLSANFDIPQAELEELLEDLYARI